MIKYKVPVLLQNIDSSDCGLVTSKMVLRYFDSEELLSDIDKKLTLDDDGCTIEKIGIYFLKNNFIVELNVFSTFFFKLSDSNMSQKKLKIFFKEKFLEDESFSWMSYLLEFIELGGKINLKIHNEKLIKKSLDEGNLIIANCTTNFLNKNSKPKTNLHFVTLTGFSNNYIYFNDPLIGKSKCTFNNFIYSLHSLSYDGFFSGTFISIKKPFL